MRCLLVLFSFSLVVIISPQACPPDWRLSDVNRYKCYYVGAEKKIWFDAEAYCTNAGPNAYLTSIASAYENYNVNAVVMSTSSVTVCDQFWIGANDFDANGTFAWVDGAPWSYASWAPGQPDLYQQCVSSTARTTGAWKTEACGIENCFICEMFIDGSITASRLPTSSSLTTTTQTSIVNSPSTTPTVASTTMTDCKDWLVQGGAHTDGIYLINPNGKGSFNVFCDMTTDGGGWTVFQRRTDGTVSFYDKSWNNYKVGFNNGLENNMWLGNDNIHMLTTKDSNVELWIDIWGDQQPNSPNSNGYWWEKRNGFSIDDEGNFYTLHIHYAYTGNASTDPSQTMYYSNNRPFSTFDSIHDTFATCISTQQMGGWWFANDGCANEALNGKYIPPNWSGDGFYWYTGSPNWINPKQSRMMLRRSS